MQSIRLILTVRKARNKEVKQMKKTFLVLIFVFAATCATLLSSCNSLNHEHTGEWHTTESTHYYQYTCGCPSPDIAELHSDYDENFICDICGYS